MCPRYMNVPLPAPCHVNVAGVGKQSVWGLRIITGTQLSLWHDDADSSIAKYRALVNHDPVLLSFKRDRWIDVSTAPRRDPAG